jgi:hypothetical protein
VGDLFPHIRKDFKKKSSIPRRSRRGLFIHNSNQIYSLDDRPRIGMIEELLKQEFPVKTRDLMLSWLENISATQSFVNNHETGGIIQQFLDIITDFVNQDIVRCEDDE